MSEQDDRVFLKRFSLVIAALVAFTILILVLALVINNRQDQEESAALDVAKAERIKPVAGVYAGDNGRDQAAAEEVAAEQDETAAFGGSLDGSMIYEQTCRVCHISGAGGAPLMEPAAWEDRLDKGTEGLVTNAINGIGAMPPRGGRGDLTDEQVEAAVEHMLDMLSQ